MTDNKKRKITKQQMADFWYEEFFDKNLFPFECVLCEENCGLLKTKTNKMQPCICPNGRARKKYYE